MGEKRTFAEILEEKLGVHREETPRPPSKSTPWGHSMGPFFIHEKHKFSPTKNPYPKVRRVRKAPKKPPTIEQQEPPTPKEDTLTYWQLSTQGQQAFRLFNQLGGMLEKESVTAKKIKKEYRRLAKKYHPDQSRGINSDNFIRLKKLEAILTQATACGDSESCAV